jgi:uncharacterized protein YjbI with pentapeptide repeats
MKKFSSVQSYDYINVILIIVILILVIYCLVTSNKENFGNFNTSFREFPFEEKKLVEGDNVGLFGHGSKDPLYPDEETDEEAKERVNAQPWKEALDRIETKLDELTEEELKEQGIKRKNNKWNRQAEINDLRSELSPEQLKVLTKHYTELGRSWSGPGNNPTNIKLNNSNVTNLGLDNSNLANLGLDNSNLANAGLNPSNVANAGLNSSNLANLGLDNSNLANAGLNPSNLANIGLDNSYLANAGLNPSNLANAGLNPSNLANAGLNPSNLANLGLNPSNLANIGLDNSYLANAGLNPSNLAKLGLDNNDKTCKISAYEDATSSDDFWTRLNNCE